MKRREVEITISDHAVLRWLERAHGLDVDGLKAMLAGKVLNAAELGAVAVCLDKVRFVLRDHQAAAANAPVPVVVATVLQLDQRRGVGSDDGRDRPPPVFHHG